MRKLLQTLFVVLLASGNALLCSAQHQVGDTVTINGAKFKLTGANLIPNPGFEEGFSGWTDASSSAAELSSDNFKLVTSGGIGDSQYLVGTTNSSSSAAGSIGTGWAIEAGKTYYFSYYVKYEDNTAAAGTEQYTKISLTNDKTSSDEPFVLLGEATVNGNGQWTLNEVAFTNSTPYTYLAARFRWLNNRQGFDGFSLHEAYEIPSTTALETAIAEAQGVYDPQALGAVALADAIAAAQSFLTSESAEAIKQATVTLEEAIKVYTILNASATAPVDMTHYIVNQGFDNNDASGWNGGGTVGYHSIEYYEKTFNHHQVIEGLPAGKYTLKAQGFERPKHNDSGAAYQAGTETIYARIYAKAGGFPEKTTLFNSIYQHPYSGTGSSNGYVNTMQSAEIMFTNTSNDYFEIVLEDVLVGDNGSLTIGARSDFTQSGYWALMDNFRLLYEGLDAAIGTATKDLQQAIDAAIAVYADGSGNGATALSEAIIEAQALAAQADAGLDAIINGISELDAAVFAFGIANSTGTPPVVVTDPNFARGATAAFGRLTVSGVNAADILEQGFCWSDSPEPTIMDSRTTKYFSNSGNIYHIENLQPATVYYMRAYALTKDYAVGYGDVLKVITIPKGTVTYGLESHVTGDHRTRIDEAMRSAVDYFNNLTSIQGHYLTVNYGSGTPTAEASYGGWMRFGPSASYQRTGTALHEMGHTVGVGTHSYWYNTSGSPLRGNGTWLGDRTSRVVQFLDNNTTGVLYGDATHMWPYGINGAHEDTGSEILYIGNALIHQALGEDGLPPTNGFTTPAYTFEHTGAKYYIKNEADTRGRDTAFLVENENGNLVYQTMTPAEALANDHAAWYFEFNPANAYYRIRNAASGKYFTYKGTGTNGISLVSKETPASSENFQLMRGRIDAQIGEGDSRFTTRGYWIVRPEKQLNPQCFIASANGATSAGTFSIANTATTQRWLLLSEEEVLLVKEALSTTNLTEVNTSGITVYAGADQVEVSGIPVPSDIMIYDVSGKLQSAAKGVTGNYSQSLPKGIYVVSIKSSRYQDTEKVMVW